MKTKAKLLAGAYLSFFNNYIISHVPSRHIRRWYLKAYLGSVGKDTHFQMNVKFLHGRKVFFGDNNVINFGCLFDGRKFPIKIGNNVSIGPCASLITLGHDPQSPSFSDMGGSIVIGNYSWIGYQATILPGVTIGEGAVIAAGAVVTRSVSPYSINAGIPAKKIGERERDLKYKLKFNPILT